MPARAAAERLMRVDAALMSPACDWMTTRPEKLAYLDSRTASASSGHGSEAAGQSGPNLAKQCPGTFPIGVAPDGQVVLLYLATVPWTDDFRTFVIGHTALLAVTRVFTLRVLFPQPLRRVLADYQTVVDEEMKSPLSSETIHDLKRHFFHRRRRTDLDAIPEGLGAFLKRCAEVFAGPRFTHLYRRWLTEQEAAFTQVSPSVQEALASGRGRVEYVVVSHAYEHLSPLVIRRRPRRRQRRSGDERGDETLRTVNPFLNPAP